MLIYLMNCISTILGHIVVTEYAWDVLRWLPYPLRIAHWISAVVRLCIEGLGPPYLCEFFLHHVSPALLLFPLSCASWTYFSSLTDCHQTPSCFLCHWPCNLEWASYHALPKYMLVPLPVFDYTKNRSVWPGLDWDCFWLGNLEGVLYKNRCNNDAYVNA